MDNLNDIKIKVLSIMEGNTLVLECENDNQSERLMEVLSKKRFEMRIGKSRTNLPALFIKVEEFDDEFVMAPINFEIFEGLGKKTIQYLTTGFGNSDGLVYDSANRIRITGSLFPELN